MCLCVLCVYNNNKQHLKTMISCFSCFVCIVCFSCIVFIHTNNNRHQKFFFLFFLFFSFGSFLCFLFFSFFLNLPLLTFAALQVYYTPVCAENRPNFIPTFSTPSLRVATLSTRNGKRFRGPVVADALDTKCKHFGRFL